jgi:hypothetical protein
MGLLRNYHTNLSSAVIGLGRVSMALSKNGAGAPLFDSALKQGHRIVSPLF